MAPRHTEDSNAKHDSYLDVILLTSASTEVLGTLILISESCQLSVAQSVSRNTPDLVVIAKE